MPKPVCVTCRCEFRCEKNDTGVVIVSGDEPYQLWSGDTWKCPGCGVEIIAGFGKEPVSKRFQPKFAAVMVAYSRPGERIEYVYEKPTPKKEKADAQS